MLKKNSIRIRSNSINIYNIFYVAFDSIIVAKVARYIGKLYVLMLSFDSKMYQLLEEQSFNPKTYGIYIIYISIQTSRTDKTGMIVILFLRTSGQLEIRASTEMFRLTDGFSIVVKLHLALEGKSEARQKGKIFPEYVERWQ